MTSSPSLKSHRSHRIKGIEDFKSSTQFRDFNIDLLDNAKEISGKQLFKQYPPMFHETNKKAIFDDILQKGYKPARDRDVLLTRFRPKQLPEKYTLQQHIKTHNVQYLPDVFDYKQPTESNVVEWHMNFANHDIFAYYGGSLLAQDELQVLECPQLASIREYMISDMQSRDSFSPRVIEGREPYPILINNIERVIKLNTTNLYGNSFSASPKSTVLSACTYLKPPQIVNILAIEAPKYGHGLYSIDDIEYILKACYTGYFAAKSLARITYESNAKSVAHEPIKTVIHTGWFGCGAYGGNRTLMIILQVLAAAMVGIDELIFHTVKSGCDDEINDATSCLQNLFLDGVDEMTKDSLINKIVAFQFYWGSSNGT